MKYASQGSRVSGEGYSYNLTSKIDAERLCSQLNNYELQLTLSENTTVIKEQLNNILTNIESLQTDITQLKNKFEEMAEK